MADTTASTTLTALGALKVMHAAIAKAQESGAPQCIAVVDPGGHLLAFVRMDGAYALSVESALRKAMTAASHGRPTGGIPEGVDLRLAIATNGKRINIRGGFPIIINGHVAGAVGVGSQSQDQDCEVARAGLAAIEGAEPL
jgi:uncharacterized protein GlcG (DUF336 family)